MPQRIRLPRNAAKLSAYLEESKGGGGGHVKHLFRGLSDSDVHARPSEEKREGLH